MSGSLKESFDRRITQTFSTECCATETKECVRISQEKEGKRKFLKQRTSNKKTESQGEVWCSEGLEKS